MEREPRQLLLDLPHTVGEGLIDFLPAPSNRAAYDAVLSWPSWPSPACLLVGPAGSGKTHLAKIWTRRAGAVFLAAQDIWEPAAPLRRLAEAPACVVEDADSVDDENLLFHVYNSMVNRGGSLLLTADRPVAAWDLRLPDLRSRLLAAHLVRIGPPDDELLSALLVKQFADRQLRVDAEMVAFLVSHMERSFAAVRAVVAALDRASLRARRPVTLPLARAVLDELAQLCQQRQDEDEGELC